MRLVSTKGWRKKKIAEAPHLFTFICEHGKIWGPDCRLMQETRKHSESVPRFLSSLLLNHLFEGLVRIRKDSTAGTWDRFPGLTYTKAGEQFPRYGKDMEVRLSKDTDQLIELFQKIGFEVQLLQMTSKTKLIIITP
jgi:hypothetical protein